VAIRDEIDADARGRTVCSVFLDTVAAHGPDAAVRERDPAATGGWTSITYAGLADQVARAAAGLRALGLRPGDRVVLMLRNRIAFRVADLAVLFAGATPVSIYSTSSPEQVGWLVAHCRATMAVLDGPEELARFDVAGPDLPRIPTPAPRSRRPGAGCSTPTDRSTSQGRRPP
jgi:long-chain acyl-CoA synthetase